MRIIAEIGSVHDGSYGNALKLIEAAGTCGADTVKFQTHIAEAESLPNAPSPSYFSAEDRISYFKRTSFTKTQWMDLKAHAEKNNLKFLSSPFSLEAVDLLEEIGVEAYKIPSGEVSNIPLLEKVASTKKPTLLSSGMSGWDELDSAVAILKSGGKLTIMQCSSAYPCPPEQVGLNVLKEMADRYQIPVGFSDHTLGFAAPLAAAALGATVIEKHFTFSRLMYGSDAKNSMEPIDFKVLSDSLHQIWKMLDHPVNKSSAHLYTSMKMIFEKSIVAALDIPEGAIIDMNNICFKKPGDGISASLYREVLGKRSRRAIKANTKLRLEDIA